MKNTTTSSTGTLSLSKMEELYEQATEMAEETPIFLVSNKVLEILKKKYPKKYAKWLKEQQKPYICSWQRDFGVRQDDNRAKKEIR